ncbi:Peptidoglycan/LPS O-acetylase OafA/YrhL, contains acyltransferase and SGNH-hydrolase domains [Chitinophaga eiseniae]|uniref:Peptidoglycan/LPS O-acetylase OafA/YrhL, contains acyltransferase and SGNH-hydrolase domains n=1 Tax=Chitinophaga eiseniae TaxID=634771 RepID=A0A1T4TLP3_9BACT|nr:acyltransferase family protein [Chitinophaga eiseniae]SKA41443.1 Peptidoglycan/LPS O-acetylase OafA/YrhL, contains acyltransferase and SGNH-hydrolase domains [Chitinophaga eiseniae]
MQTSSRQTYLDWLRIIAIAGVLIFHSAMPYVAYWEWHIKNNATSHVLLEMNDFLHRFRMPLLFFISGTVSYYMLQSRSGSGFLGLRFRRLFVPLLLGILVIVPPQVYLERVTQGYKGNFWQFYAEMFRTGAYPKGNMSWHHLWFICYLLVYDILCAPLFVWWTSPAGKKWLQKLNRLASGKWIYLLMAPSAISHAFLARMFGATNDLVHDYAYFPYWMLYLIAGFVCIANPLLMDSLERNRRSSFAVAFVSIIIINYFRWNGLEPAHGWPGWTGWCYTALAVVSAWMWVFTAVGYGKRYLNRKSRVLAYANEAVYPFYILHQTVIVILTYYLSTLQEDIGLKYIFTVVVTFMISMSIFHLFIRPYAPMRFLFGMKPAAGRQVKTTTETVDNPALQPHTVPLT